MTPEPAATVTRKAVPRNSMTSRIRSGRGRTRTHPGRTTPTPSAGHEPTVNEPGIAPIVATKVAWLTRVDGVIRFSPLYERALTQPYGAVAYAVCEVGRQHIVPSMECGC